MIQRSFRISILTDTFFVVTSLLLDHPRKMVVSSFLFVEIYSYANLLYVNMRKDDIQDFAISYGLTKTIK